jgi:hypothetical protein
MEGDTARAIAVASEGATKFNDTQLATQEIELSLMSGKQKEVITKISDQAQKNPGNKLYPYYLGYSLQHNWRISQGRRSLLKRFKDRS